MLQCVLDLLFMYTMHSSCHPVMTEAAGELTLAAVLAAPMAPLFALFVVGFAANKVQGFALMKGVGVINWPPALAYFLDLKWQLVCGIVPTYWPSKVFWMLSRDEPGWWPFAVVALLYQGVLVVALVRRFERVTGR